MTYKIGIRIKKLREAAAISQAELAKSIGVAQPMITAYEKGYKMPTVPVLSRIAEKFGCTMDEIAKD